MNSPLENQTTTPRRMLPVLALTLLCLAVALPVQAAGFRLYGAFWDTDAAGDTFGGGLTVDFPVSRVLGVEFRGAYYEELSNEPLEALFEDDNPVFQDGLEDIPLEAGIRLDFARETAFNPFVSGGLSYHLLDSEFGEVDDEFGWYAGGGFELGAQQGAGLFVEALYRDIEGSVAVDPDALDDIDDLDFEGDVPLDLSGFGANVGVVWRF